VNAKAKINVPFGTSLTGIAKLPAGASVDLSDRYAPKSSFLPKLALIVIVLACVWSFLNDNQGRLYTWTDGAYGSTPSKEVLDQRAAADALKKGRTPAAPPTTNTVVTTVSTVVSNAPAAPAK
jgi:hypothetical protein